MVALIFATFVIAVIATDQTIQYIKRNENNLVTPYTFS